MLGWHSLHKCITMKKRWLILSSDRVFCAIVHYFNTRAMLSPGNRAKPCKFRYEKSVRNFMWKLCYRKDRAMRPVRGCPENFRGSLTTPTATIPKIFHGLLFRCTLWMFLQNLKAVGLPVPEIIRGTKNFGSPWKRPCSLFSNISIGFYSDWPWECTRQIWSL